MSLNIIVLPKLGSRAEQAPMFWLDGGPGVPGTNSAALYTNDLKFHRERRAVVMFDQRGTGKSAPLHCPKIERRSPLADPWPKTDLVSCRQDLDARADLSQYSTLAAARDVDAVRSALGYEKIDIAALSYGTLLAQTYLQLYGARVRSVALIGSVPLGEKLPLHHAANAEHALRQVFSDCRLEKACHAAFPHPEHDWATLQQQLSDAPVVVRSGQRKLVARKGPLDEFIRGMLNTPDGQRRLPALVSRAARGDYTQLLEALDAQAPEPAAEGLYLSVTCPEATDRIRRSEIASAVGGSSFGRYRIDQQIDACSDWIRSKPRVIPPSAAMPREIPVLLLSGGRDATTPTAWAKRVAAGLPNSRVVVFKYMTHLPIGLKNIECVDRIMDAFFLIGSVQPLDVRCRRAMRPPKFVVGPPGVQP